MTWKDKPDSNGWWWYEESGYFTIAEVDLTPKPRLPDGEAFIYGAYIPLTSLLGKWQKVCPPCQPIEENVKTVFCKVNENPEPEAEEVRK